MARRHPEIVREAALQGHAIANHTTDHPSLPLVSQRERWRQIRSCSQALAPYEQKLFRPPYGQQTQNLDFASREVVGKRDIAVSRMQQRVDIDDQACHPKSARELLGLAQSLKAQAALCICLPGCKERTVPE